MKTATQWDFLTLDEVAIILRIGKRTAYELARTGRLGGATKSARSEAVACSNRFRPFWERCGTRWETGVEVALV